MQVLEKANTDAFLRHVPTININIKPILRVRRKKLSTIAADGSTPENVE